MNDSWRGSWKGEITSRGSLAGGLLRDIVVQQPSAQNGHDGNAMDLRYRWGHSVSGAEKRSKLWRAEDGNQIGRDPSAAPLTRGRRERESEFGRRRGRRSNLRLFIFCLHFQFSHSPSVSLSEGALFTG